MARYKAFRKWLKARDIHMNQFQDLTARVFFSMGSGTGKSALLRWLLEYERQTGS